MQGQNIAGDKPPPYTSSNRRSCTQCNCPRHRHPESAEAVTRRLGIEGWSLYFQLRPKLDSKFQTWGGWRAYLDIMVDNLPRLMREGVHWTPANVEMEKGYMEWGAVVTWTTSRKAVVHHYTLMDLSEDPRWMVTLSVYAEDVGILSWFMVSDLSPDSVCYGLGENNGGWAVYQYDAWEPELGFNTIYDDMPLGGWWPWPNEDAAAPAVAAADKQTPVEGQPGISPLQSHHK